MATYYNNLVGFQTPKAVSPLIPTFPFKDEGDGATIVWRQRFAVLRANYTAPTLDTLHPTLSPHAYLVGDEGFVEGRAGRLIFTRVWANIPAQRFVPSSTRYRFIGIRADLFGGTSFRPRFTEVVDAVIQYDYYLPGVSSGVATISDIPRVGRQRYFRTVQSWRDINFLWFDTTPTRDAYLDMVAAGTEIVAEDSTRETWMGNIVERRIIRIVAQ